jgi:hypothetical protein
MSSGVCVCVFLRMGVPFGEWGVRNVCFCLAWWPGRRSASNVQAKRVELEPQLKAAHKRVATEKGRKSAIEVRYGAPW